MVKKCPEITFAGYRLLEASAKDLQPALDSRGGSGEVALAPEVYFAHNSRDKKAPFHVLVIVKLVATLSEHKKEKGDLPRVEATISGQGRFEITNISARNFAKTYEDSEFLDGLADRVYPLVLTQLQRLLDDMGYGTGRIPLSLPEKNRHEVLNSESNGNAKSITEKGRVKR